MKNILLITVLVVLGIALLVYERVSGEVLYALKGTHINAGWILLILGVVLIVLSVVGRRKKDVKKVE